MNVFTSMVNIVFNSLSGMFWEVMGIQKKQDEMRMNTDKENKYNSTQTILYCIIKPGAVRQHHISLSMQGCLRHHFSTPPSHLLPRSVHTESCPLRPLPQLHCGEHHSTFFRLLVFKYRYTHVSFPHRSPSLGMADGLVTSWQCDITPSTSSSLHQVSGDVRGGMNEEACGPLLFY